MGKSQAFLSDFTGFAFRSNPKDFLRSVVLMTLLIFLTSTSSIFDGVVRRNIDYSLSHQDSSSIYAYSLSDNEVSLFSNEPIVRQYLSEGGSIIKIPHTFLGLLPRNASSTPTYQAFFADDLQGFGSLYRTHFESETEVFFGAIVSNGILEHWREAGYTMSMGETIYVVSGNSIIDEAPFGGGCEEESVSPLFSPIDTHKLTKEYVVFPNQRFEAWKDNLPYLQYDLIVKCGKAISAKEGTLVSSLLGDYDTVIKNSLGEREYKKIDLSLLSFLRQACFVLALFSSIVSFLYLSALFERKKIELVVRRTQGMTSVFAALLLLCYAFFVALCATLLSFGARFIVWSSLARFVGTVSSVCFFEARLGPLLLFYILYGALAFVVTLATVANKYLTKSL